MKTQNVTVISRDSKSTYTLPMLKPIRIPVVSTARKALKGGTTVEMLAQFGAKTATMVKDRKDVESPGILLSTALGVEMYADQETGSHYIPKKQVRCHRFYFSSGFQSTNYSRTAIMEKGERRFAFQKGNQAIMNRTETKRPQAKQLTRNILAAGMTSIGSSYRLVHEEEKRSDIMEWNDYRRGTQIQERWESENRRAVRQAEEAAGKYQKLTEKLKRSAISEVRNLKDQNMLKMKVRNTQSRIGKNRKSTKK